MKLSNRGETVRMLNKSNSELATKFLVTSSIIYGLKNDVASHQKLILLM